MRQRVVQVYLRKVLVVRKVMVAVIATATAVGCSHTVTGSALRSDGGVPDPDRSYGYVNDRCGLLDNSTVQSTLGAEEVTRPYSGAVCQYILLRDSAGESGTVDVIFSWFDAGSLERERAVATARGAAITEVVVERHKGFLARRDTTGAACSATAAAGTGVLSWWVQYRGRSAGDPCVDAEKLLSATLRSDL
jgi:hypothetical protein